jgi:hypothetical protein
MVTARRTPPGAASHAVLSGVAVLRRDHEIPDRHPIWRWTRQGGDRANRRRTRSGAVIGASSPSLGRL